MRTNSENTGNLCLVVDAMSYDRQKSGKGSAPFLFSCSLSSVDKTGRANPIDTSKTDSAAVFFQNYKYWNKETGFLSTNNFNNSYFTAIVDMGLDAVPFILEEIERRPSQLVHALDLIFPGVMKYDGFVSLKDACERWISILQ